MKFGHKTNKLISKSYLESLTSSEQNYKPLTCAICNRKGAPNNDLYDVSRRIYNHHIFPKEIFGREYDHKFIPCCGLCHNLIHKVLRDMRKIKSITEQDCCLAIDLVKKKRKQLVDFSSYPIEQQDLMKQLKTKKSKLTFGDMI